MNKIIAGILIIIFLFAAYWLGEEGRGLLYLLPYLIGLFGLVLIPYLLSKKWVSRISISFIFLTVYAVTFYMGHISFYKAYNSCIDEAEQVRVALSDYKSKNGKFPGQLAALNIHLPCSRCLRGTILEYESTVSNYRIRFKDWLVEYTATDEDPFRAYK